MYTYLWLEICFDPALNVRNPDESLGTHDGNKQDVLWVTLWHSIYIKYQQEFISDVQLGGISRAVIIRLVIQIHWALIPVGSY